MLNNYTLELSSPGFVAHVNFPCGHVEPHFYDAQQQLENSENGILAWECCSACFFKTQMATKILEEKNMPVNCIVSFSITGKPGVITAKKTFPSKSAIKDSNCYVSEMSPIPVLDDLKKDGIMLSWPRLLDKEGFFETNPKRVVRLFNMLKRNGWEINDTPFRKRHFKA